MIRYEWPAGARGVRYLWLADAGETGYEVGGPVYSLGERLWGSWADLLPTAVVRGFWQVVRNLLVSYYCYSHY